MKKSLLLAAVALATQVSAAPRVVSSIYPLQQIANAIVGQPTELISDTYLSPHQYAVRPADMAKIADADIVLWVGPALMPQLDKYIDRRPKEKATLTAVELPDIKLLESNHHHKNDEKPHDLPHVSDHKEAASTHHRHDEHNEHEEHDTHNHGNFNYDPHIWLSTHNAKVIAKSLAVTLSEQDKSNTAVYQNNLKQFLGDLDKTKSHIIGNFESHPAPNYYIFHNAYAYFEHEFGLEHSGVITLHGGQSPKAGHLNLLKKRLKNAKNTCLFREPQFDSKIVKRLAAGSNVTVAVLDPVGYQKDKNIGYTTILRNIAEQIANCGE